MSLGRRCSDGHFRFAPPRDFHRTSIPTRGSRVSSTTGSRHNEVVPFANVPGPANLTSTPDEGAASSARDAGVELRLPDAWSGCDDPAYAVARPTIRQLPLLSVLGLALMQVRRRPPARPSQRLACATSLTWPSQPQSAELEPHGQVGPPRPQQGKRQPATHLPRSQAFLREHPVTASISLHSVQIPSAPA
jgi:hypothetical protein